MLISFIQKIFLKKSKRITTSRIGSIKFELFQELSTYYIQPKGILTKTGMKNYEGVHSEWYKDFPELKL